MVAFDIWLVSVIVLSAALVCIAAWAIARGASVKLTFHPPWYVKIEVQRKDDPPAK